MTASLPATGSPARLILAALRVERRAILVGALAGICWMGAIALVPVVVGGAIDGAVDQDGPTDVRRWVAAVAAVVLVGALAGVVRHRIAVGLWVRTSRRVEQHITRRVLDRRSGSFPDAGTLLAAATTDAGRVGTVADLMCRGTGAIVTFVGVGVYLMVISPSLGVLVLVGLPITLGALSPLWPIARRRSEAQRAHIAGATSTAADTVLGIRTIKGFRAEATATAWFDDSVDGVERSGVSFARVAGAWFAVSSAVPAVFLAVVLGVAGRAAVSGDLSAGDVVAVTGLATFLSIPLGTIAELGIVWSAGLAGARKVTEIRDTPHAVSGGGTSTPTGRASLRFDQVRTAHLHGLDLTVGSDEMVGVIAADDRALADIVSLVERTSELGDEGGVVGLGPIDVRSLDLDSYRDRVLVERADDPWLRSGTVGRQLDLAVAERESPDVRVHRHGQALRVAGLDELEARPGALSIELGERGLRLSGGQRQRLGVARAVRRSPDVLVVTQPTSALDSVTEARVVSRLVRERAGRCTLIVSSSAAMLAVCDRVVLIDDGRVADSGDHAALLEQSRDYRRLIGLTT